MALEGPLLRSVAHYLYHEKRRGSDRMLDPVGNFHVANGAILYRVNFLANTTSQGSRESGCTMVNYWYHTPMVTKNVSQYETCHAVAVDPFITDLLENENH